ncbi:MAG: hypothetical protein HY403_00135 [Elusimicrobia bacterium]|nr:hypothetical protein [Elusimicrobiota bacterium]
MYKEGGALLAWALALALLVLGLPIHNPDLFWHLSAGRWILAHGAVPASDPFSFTRFGAPWIDFEWLTQALWFGVNAAAGLRGLWALKAVMLALAFLPLDGILRDKGASPAARAAGLGLWTCAILASADLRADLFTAAFAALLLRRLESGRALFLFGFGLFALWGNLHAGFPVGLALYAAYALGARFFGGPRPAGLGAEACGALLGVLLNPYGLKIYAAIAAHGDDSIGRFVREWGPVDWRSPFQRPLIPALFVGAAAARAAWPRAPALAMSAGALAFATAASARFSVCFAAAAVACLAAAWPRARASWAAAGLAAATVLIAGASARAAWGRAFSDAYVARRAVDFVVAERAVFAPLRLFNTYEWGGYLGWRLGPEGRVYGDGRYLFHGQLAELQEALAGAAPMAAFIERNRLDALLIRNYPARTAGARVYPDGSRRELTRPWYISYLPRERWALVWWDVQALVFVDRARVPAPWLAAHEYRWWRPGDGEALSDALARGEAVAAEVEAERSRHGY